MLDLRVSVELRDLERIRDWLIPIYPDINFHAKGWEEITAQLAIIELCIDIKVTKDRREKAPQSGL